MMKAIILAAIEIILWMTFGCAFLVSLLGYVLYVFDLGDLFVQPTIILVLCLAALTGMKELRQKENKE